MHGKGLVRKRTSEQKGREIGKNREIGEYRNKFDKSN